MRFTEITLERIVKEIEHRNGNAIVRYIYEDGWIVSDENDHREIVQIQEFVSVAKQLQHCQLEIKQNRNPDSFGTVNPKIYYGFAAATILCILITNVIPYGYLPSDAHSSEHAEHLLARNIFWGIFGSILIFGISAGSYLLNRKLVIQKKLKKHTRYLRQQEKSLVQQLHNIISELQQTAFLLMDNDRTILFQGYRSQLPMQNKKKWDDMVLDLRQNKHSGFFNLCEEFEKR
jgi:hypothetical protein